MTKCEKIKNYILNNINSGKWKIDHKIDDEKKLIKQFDTSKMTVRKVIQDLNRLEIIYSKRGVGTFVSPFAIYSKFNSLMKEVGADNIEAFETNKPIPKEIFKLLGSSYKIDTNLFKAYCRVYFKKKQCQAYSINWISSKPKIKYEQIEKIENNIVDIKGFTKIIKIKRNEPITKTDKSFLNITSDYVVTQYSYYIVNEREIAMIRIAKTLPQYLTSFEVLSHK